MRDSLTWKYEQKGFRKSGVKTGLVCLSSGWSLTGLVSDLDGLIKVVCHRVVSYQGGLSSGWFLIRVVSHLGGLSSGWSLTRVVSNQGGVSSGYSHPGGLSSGWSHQDGLSLG